MKAKRTASFEQLMNKRYGGDAPAPRRFAETIEDLLGSYYGAPPPSLEADAAPKRAVAKSFSADDGGEVLEQVRRAADGARAMSRPFSAPVEPMPPALDTLQDEERARQERLLDLCAAPPTTSAATPEPAGPPPTSPAPAATPAPPASPPGSPASPTPTAQAASEDEFLADMKAILSGQKAYDPATKSLTDRHAIAVPPEARDNPPAPPASQPPPHVPPPGGGHDIFQRIAQSMEYAGAYDLGSVELENRFAQFDETAEKRRPKVAGSADGQPAIPVPPAPAVVAPPPPPPAPKLDEFKTDLQDMLARPKIPELPVPPAPEQYFPEVGGGDTAPPVPAMPMWATESASYVEPFYASGEHARAGEGLYPNALVIGQAPGVAFSYGELIAMGDLFANPDEMIQAPVDQLREIKNVLKTDIAHYQPGGSAMPEPSTEDWERVTHGRYLRLAADNYDHYAPNILFRDAKFVATVSQHRDHRGEWEKYHLRALGEVHSLKPGLDPNLTHNQRPLIINAFGDHYLTDAFAAGHIVNKAAIMDLFMANFYAGRKLTKAGETFFETVAKLAFKGKLASKFSALETYDPKFLWWNPNIDSPGRFAQVLIGIANAESDKVANLAVKAIHDKLNKEGIEVTNGVVVKPWQLTGDGHLTEETLKMMQATVKQSVANILDPAARQPGFDPKPFLARVWNHVPQLTEKSLAYLRQQIPNFINPNSVWLSGAAAQILNGEVEMLIDELLKRKILKPA